jgi:ABC-2 type transport system ATP-binding protein
MSADEISQSSAAPERSLGAPGAFAIEVTGLTKAYGEHVVLDGVDLSVREGAVFSLLGPNGAGKTTIVRILSTLTAADAGEARVAGCDVRLEPMAVRSAIGVTGQFSAVDNYLTAEENLLLMAQLWHMPRRQGRARQGVTRAVRAGRRGPQAGLRLLRGDAAPAGPRDDAGGLTPDHLPRRADHRS